jgi:carbonic anhydrase
VILRGFWTSAAWPRLQGGPLNGAYDFFNVLFHWGPSNQEGSEHTLDYVRYPMELQVIHTKHGIKTPMDAIALGAKDGIVIVSFFLQVGFFPLTKIVFRVWRFLSRDHGAFRCSECGECSERTLSDPAV